jgi:potassium-dependent mechanosensitive channel
MQDTTTIAPQLFKVLNAIWQYPILTVDENAITVGSIVIGFSLLIFGVLSARYLAKKILRRILSRFTLEKSVHHTFEAISFYVLLMFSTLFALSVANVPLTIFTVFGGILAIGLGFGSQNIVNNFISGLILMFERPVKVGDFIELDGLLGEVQHIGMRSTHIRAAGNRHIIVPNSSFLEKNVLNWTHDDSMIRVPIQVGVAYGSPTEKVREMLIQAVLSEEKVLQSPDKEPIVLFIDFGDNALQFEVYFWILLEDLWDRKVIESNIRFRIDHLFREAELVIAFPQRDVHLHTHSPLDVRMHGSDR